MWFSNLSQLLLRLLPLAGVDGGSQQLDQLLRLHLCYPPEEGCVRRRVRILESRNNFRKQRKNVHGLFRWLADYICQIESGHVTDVALIV